MTRSPVPLTLCVMFGLATGVEAQPGEPPGPRDAAEQILQLRRELEQSAGAPEAYRLRADDADLRRELRRLAGQDRDAPPPERTADAVRVKSTRTRKRLLRETAFQLDTMAHRLEMQELYRHADDLRGLANRLRHDARQTGDATPTLDPGFSPPGMLIPAAAPQTEPAVD